MAMFKLLATLAFGFVLSNAHVYSQSLTQETFESQLFSLSEISHFGINETRYSALTEIQLKSVLGAKSTLIEILKALQEKNGASTEFLSDSLRKKYPTKRALAESLIDEETSLLGLVITDFSVSKDSSHVQLNFSVILSTEGMILVNKRKVLLIAVNSTWKLASFS